ncbi:MAG: cysteine desulfurase [Thermoplasmatales archaeon]|nr:cysteine desulfurase [Thermoplasmatales archaeon]
MRRAYFDNGATTALDPAVLERMMPYLAAEYGNPGSMHYLGDAAAAGVRTARKEVADTLGCLPSEIVFTSGGTESDNLAVIGAMVASGKRRAVTCAVEHSAVLESFAELRRRGFETTVLGVDGEGRVSAGDLEAAMGPDVGLVSIMTANNEIGTVMDIRGLAEVAHSHGALFHTDAVQAYTKAALGKDDQGFDLLSLSAHKIHGPKGVGALFVRSGTPMAPTMFGGGQENGLRSSTENVPGIVGLGAAAATGHAAMGRVVPKIGKMRKRIIEGIREIPGSTMNGPADGICNIVNFSFEGVSGKDLVIALSNEGIAASAAAACSAGSSDPSHVVMAISGDVRRAMGALRVSLSKFTTDADVDFLLETLPETVARMRKR